MINEPEVISFSAAGHVVTFKSYSYARMILLKEYHKTIFQDARDLANRKSLEDLYHIVTKVLKLDLHAGPTRLLLEIKDKNELAEKLWTMLIMTGRATNNRVLGKLNRNPKLPTHTTYFCDYVPGEDNMLDLNYIKLPPQARVLVDMLVDHVQPTGNVGVPEYILIKHIHELHNAGILKTKQPVMSIWKYYFNIFVAKGFVDVKKPTK
jgi:hypothetical protein